MGHGAWGKKTEIRSQRSDDRRSSKLEAESSKGKHVGRVVFALAEFTRHPMLSDQPRYARTIRPTNFWLLDTMIIAARKPLPQ